MGLALAAPYVRVLGASVVLTVSVAVLFRPHYVLQMDWTDRHYRFMMRMITKRTLLFTEMLVDQTVRKMQ